jgi:hypothetical protein
MLNSLSGANFLENLLSCYRNRNFINSKFITTQQTLAREKNSAKGKTVMREFNTLWEKWVKGTQMSKNYYIILIINYLYYVNK